MSARGAFRQAVPFLGRTVLWRFGVARAADGPHCRGYGVRGHHSQRDGGTNARTHKIVARGEHGGITNVAKPAGLSARHSNFGSDLARTSRRTAPHL